MMKSAFRSLLAVSALALAACGYEDSSSTGSGGQSGGSSSSSVSSGGGQSSGGQSSGGQSSAGQSSGGQSSGGQSSAGSSATGGKGGGGSSATGGKGGGGGGATSSGGGGGKTGGASGTGGAAEGGKTETGGNGSAGTGGKGTGGKTGGNTGGGGAATGGTTGTGGSSGSGGSSGAKLHVFLLLGQSNMAGYAKATTADKQNNPRIRVIGFDDCAETGRKKDQWADATPPLHECWNKAIGPGDSFSQALLEKVPATDSILLVPCALSGKSINDMKKGTSNYTWFISRAKSAVQLGGVIEGFIFHQGESDCGQSSWPNAVKQFVTDLRTDLGLTNNPPFVAGELPRASACSNHNPLVNQLPNLITNGYVVSSEGIPLDPADTQYRMHFGHDGSIEIGKRFATKMAEALKW